MILLLSGGAALAGRAFDHGGGSKDPYSPYKLSMRLTADEVAKTQQQADRAMTVRWQDNSSTKVTWNNAALSFDRPGSKLRPMYEISGKDASGHDVRIHLSSLKSMNIEQFSEDRTKALIGFEEFPALTPRELVDSSPTYEMLDTSHRKRVSMWLTLSDSKGKQLFIVGEPSSNTPNSHARANQAVAGLSPTAGVTFEPGRKTLIWWAIPSVANSAGYPFRKPAAGR